MKGNNVVFTAANKFFMDIQKFVITGSFLVGNNFKCNGKAVFTKNVYGANFGNESITLKAHKHPYVKPRGIFSVGEATGRKGAGGSLSGELDITAFTGEHVAPDSAVEASDLGGVAANLTVPAHGTNQGGGSAPNEPSNVNTVVTGEESSLTSTNETKIAKRVHDSRVAKGDTDTGEE